jgi:hypothetical protein
MEGEGRQDVVSRVRNMKARESYRREEGAGQENTFEDEGEAS